MDWMSMKKAKRGSVGKHELAPFAETLRKDGPRTVRQLLEALFIWLFGVLVFIPLAASMGWRTELAVSLIVLAAFSVVVYRALPGMKRLMDALSPVLAERSVRRGSMSARDAEVVFRHSFYLVAIAVLYLTYLPFLLSFHPALAGVVLIAMILLASVLLIRILLPLGRMFLGALKS